MIVVEGSGEVEAESVECGGNNCAVRGEKRELPRNAKYRVIAVKIASEDDRRVEIERAVIHDLSLEIIIIYDVFIDFLGFDLSKLDCYLLTLNESTPDESIPGILTRKFHCLTFLMYVLIEDLRLELETNIDIKKIMECKVT